MENNYTIIKKDGNFYIKCDLSQDIIYLCEANDLNTLFIDDHAKWTYQRMKKEREFQKWENSVIF